MENPVGILKELRERVRKLISDHEEGARRFRQNAAVGGVLIEMGVRWLEEDFGFPGRETRTAAENLRAQWKETPEYKGMWARLNDLIEEAESLLRRIFRRPPSLANVHRGVMLNTKATRLDGILSGAISRTEAWLALDKSIPVGSTRVSRSKRRPAVRVHKKQPLKLWREWLAIIAAFVTIAGFIFLLSNGLIGFEVALLTSVALAFLVVLALILVSRRMQKVRLER